MENDRDKNELEHHQWDRTQDSLPKRTTCTNQGRLRARSAYQGLISHAVNSKLNYDSHQREHIRLLSKLNISLVACFLENVITRTLRSIGWLSTICLSVDLLELLDIAVDIQHRRRPLKNPPHLISVYFCSGSPFTLTLLFISRYRGI